MLRQLLRLAAASWFVVLCACSSSGDPGGAPPLIAPAGPAGGAADGAVVQDYGAFRITVHPDGRLVRQWARDGRTDDVSWMQRIHLVRGIEVVRPQPLAPQLERVAAGPRLRLLHTRGPADARFATDLAAAGLVVVGYVPVNAFVVFDPGDRTRPALAGKAQQIDLLRDWDGPDRLHPAVDPTRDAQDVAVFVVRHAGDGETGALIEAAALRSFAGPSEVKQTRVYRVRLPGATLGALALRPDVLWIEPYVIPELVDERQGLIQAGAVAGGAPTGPGYTGWLAAQGVDLSTVQVDVTDSGCDRGAPDLVAHPDLPQPVYVNNFTGAPLGNDVDGHGTLNYSIAGGIVPTAGAPGTLDEGGYLYGLGVAPGARMAATKVFHARYWDIGDATLTDVVSAARAGGSLIVSNSWGADVYGEYTADAQLYDVLVRDADGDPGNGLSPVVVLFAAGNAGADYYYGQEVLQSVGAPGTAKNVLTIGASENYRIEGQDGCGIGPEGADDATDLAAFSSRGPTADGRLKPELVAPGTHIQGAASTDPEYGIEQGVCNLHWPEGQSRYAWSSGTSHATPAAAGAAAVLMAWYTQEHGAPPSPALVKAMLAAHAADLAGGNDGFGRSLEPVPSIRQGWGRVDLGSLLAPTGRIVTDQTELFEATGQDFVRAPLRPLDPAAPVRVALAWTDAPGAPYGGAWNNDLDLEVIVDGAIVYRGNAFEGGFSMPDGDFDHFNNLEIVALPAGAGTVLEVHVIAANLNSDGVPGNDLPVDQDFALYVRNAQERFPCAVDADCDDGSPCTVEFCDTDGLCTTHPACTDGLRCTRDHCDRTTGECSYPPLGCDDGNECTVDECDEGAGCVATAVADCTACAGGAGMCIAGACAPVGLGCVVEVGGVVCPLAEGAACEDGEPCTLATTCQAGACLGDLAPDGSDCKDYGDFCVESAVCEAGVCVPVPVSCDDGEPCTTDGCDPRGGCWFDWRSCDDGNACTGDECVPGVGCAHRRERCEDGDACTDRACDPALGCLFQPVACDDGDPCTADTCDRESGCQYPPLCDDGNACTADFCTDGECSYLNLPDGEACAAPGDGNECTLDTCQAGVCVGAALPDCTGCAGGAAACVAGLCGGRREAEGFEGGVLPDGWWTEYGPEWQVVAGEGFQGSHGLVSPALDWALESALRWDGGTGSGVLRFLFRSEGDARLEVYVDGSYMGGFGWQPDWRDVTVPVYWSGSHSVVFHAYQYWEGAPGRFWLDDVGIEPEGGVCDDGLDCTVGGLGDEGCVTCPAGDGTVCDDGEPCTADTTCQAGACTGPALPDGTDCQEPGDVCVEQAQCLGGACQRTPVTCWEDEDPCTIAVCRPEWGGCGQEWNDCDDGDACTWDGCDPERGCVHYAMWCDDGSDCTVDTCDPVVGCLFTPVACDDGDPCTADVCVPGSGCQFPPLCDDGNPCTEDACDAGTCTATPFADGSACAAPGDGNECTTDACQAGVCVSEGLPDCTLCAGGTRVCLEGQCGGLSAAEGFESGALPPGWWTEGDAPWQVDPSEPGSGLYSAGSGDIGDGGVSVLSFEVELATDGEVRFLHREETEAWYDYLTLVVDGVQWAGWSGVNAWSEFAAPLPAGWHRIEWQYRKDGSVSVGRDRVWVDEVFVGAAGPACDDGDACTLDALGAEGCVACPLADGAGCDDGEPCTFGTACQAGACLGEALPDGADCKDPADVCTVSAWCTGGVCERVPLDCEDGEPCTVGVCEPASGGCVQSWDPCDDGDLCTWDSCEPGLGCVHGPGSACDDGDACTVDSCDPELGCDWTFIDCDDGDLCTWDACDPSVGCFHGAACDDGDPCTLNGCTDGACSFEPAPDGSVCTPPGAANECAVASCQGGVCVAADLPDCTPCDGGAAVCVEGRCGGAATVEGFESGALPAGWLTYGDSLWEVVAGEGIGGSYAAGGGREFFGMGSWLGVDVVLPEDREVSFQHRLDGPSGPFVFAFMVDGEMVDMWGGPHGWTEYRGVFPAGPHRFEWATAAPSGLGRGWIDDVDLGGGEACDDGNPCTLEGRGAGDCVVCPLADGAACDDGAPCTVGTTCQAGACLGGVLPDGSDCADPADPCTLSAVCAAGVCLVEPFVCPPAEDPCTLSVCRREWGGCGYEPNPCDDGDPCTRDWCEPGSGCDHGPACDDGNPCTADTCDGGACTFEPAGDGQPCADDGNECTEGEVCQAGVCVGGPVPDCTLCGADGGAACVAGLCGGANAIEGFEGGVLPAGWTTGGDAPWEVVEGVHATSRYVAGSGDIGDTQSSRLFYTVDLGRDGELRFQHARETEQGWDFLIVLVDGEQRGAWSGFGGWEEFVTPLAAGPHVIEWRYQKDGSVSSGADRVWIDDVDVGGGCGDGDPCTAEGRAPGGDCVFCPLPEGQACDDREPCTVDTTCQAGVCAGALLPDGEGCADPFDVCTLSAQCVAGVCEREPLVCDDEDACTADRCDPRWGCRFDWIGCYDGSPCTWDSCDPAVGCVYGNVCDDWDACTEDVCVVGVDCLYLPVACDDGDACNGVESCDWEWGCVEGAPLFCDDGDPCTVDACDPALGCTTAPLCDDGDPCTVDTCDPAGSCTYAPYTCGDGNACTTDECDGLGGCTHGAVSCDDGNPCTTDRCLALLGCQHVRRTGACDDGDVCTTKDRCVAGTCRGTALSCNDGNPCTVDACQPGIGCTSAPAPDGAPCDDGAGLCAAGVCEPLPGATCDEPAPLALDVPVDGDFGVYADSMSFGRPCTSGQDPAWVGPDVFFALDLDADTDYVVTALGPGVRVAAFEACDDLRPCLVAEPEEGGAVAATLVIPRGPAREWVLAVTAPADEAAWFTVLLEVLAEP